MCKFLCTCHVHILIRIKLKFSRKVVIVSLNICVKFQNKQTRHLSTVLLQSWQKLPIFQWRPTWWRHQVMMTSSRKVYTCPNAHAKRLSFRRVVRNCSIYCGSRYIRVVNLLVSVTPVCMYVAILKPRGLRQSGSSLHLGGGQSRESELQVIESDLASETMNHRNINNS